MRRGNGGGRHLAPLTARTRKQYQDRSIGGKAALEVTHFEGVISVTIIDTPHSAAGRIVTLYSVMIVC